MLCCAVVLMCIELCFIVFYLCSNVLRQIVLYYFCVELSRMLCFDLPCMGCFELCCVVFCSFVLFCVLVCCDVFCFVLVHCG